MGLRRGFRRRAQRPVDAPAAAATPAAPTPARTAPRQPVLLDAAADAHLAAQGYAVLDLLGPGECQELIRRWEELSVAFPPIWDPTGFSTTLRHPGVDGAADEAIRPTVEARLRTFTTRVVPFMSGYLVKQPHSSELPAHLDWNMVDDASVETFGCWVPLEDTEPGRGALGVVPGSHLSVDFERTPEDPGHEWAADHIAGGGAEVLLELKAGQAVFFDHRLIHFSAANEADAVRVAVNSGLCEPALVDEARARLVAMMARGMAGSGSDPQIPV